MRGSELRPIPGFPNYRVTEEGRIWTDPRPRVKGGWMAMHEHERGYLYTKGRIDGRPVKMYAHRMVALAWLGDPPDGKTMVCHSDGNPRNNHASNLYWGDQFDNMADRTRHGNSRAGGKW